MGTARICREERREMRSGCSVANLTIGSLAKGLAVLLALLIVAGLVGGVGSVELLIWLGLAAAWIAWWMASRRKGEATP